MARIIKLKESDITNIVRRILREDSHYGMGKDEKSRTRPGQKDYTGHKGNLSRTHKGRDYEEGKSDITYDTMMKSLGNPRTMDDLLMGYEKAYNMAEDGGMPTPDEVASRVMEIDNTGGGDPEPVAMIVWWLVGIAIGLGIRWINTGKPPWVWESDVTLKENIELVGKSKSGINIYEFDYINKKYGNGRYRGVMAQEVPSASFVGPEGTLMVNYSKIDVNFEELN